MSSVNVINKSKEKVNVEVNEINGSIQIVIDVPPAGKELSSFAPGEVFEKNGVKYIVCEHFEGGDTAVIRKECLKDSIKFDDKNNWAKSGIRKFLNSKYLENISDAFGLDNILDHEVDLLSLDGYDDYGRTTDKFSVLTIDKYRKYHKFIGNVGQQNWLSTPDSTPSGAGASYVQYVGYGGGVDWRHVGDTCGVRPFFVLKSDVFVSSETESE